MPLLFINTLYSQVLYEETFDNLTLGNITTDPTGATPGQGNWHVSLQGGGKANIAQESNKGKVLLVETNGAGGMNAKQKNLQTVWGNRTTGNNILLVEYDFYAEELGNEGHTSRFVIETVGGYQLIDMILETKYNAALRVNETKLNVMGTQYKNFNYAQSWFTIKLYVDYNTNTLYFHIPALGFLHKAAYTATFGVVDQVHLRSGGINNTYIVHKYDNVRLAALKTVPPEVLSADDFLANKFNLYPNPAANTLNITNQENIGLQQVEIFDINGRSIKMLSFNNENEIQLNVENLANGTYLLQIQTTEGTAVKKLVKK